MLLHWYKAGGWGRGGLVVLGGGAASQLAYLQNGVMPAGERLLNLS